MSDLDQATAERHWYDLAYWQSNFPQVRLNPSDNEHVPARTLRTAWTGSGAAPIVAVEILPRTLPAPDRPGDIGWLAGVGAVLGVIPGVGQLTKLAFTALKVGVGIEHGLALQDWAKSFKGAPDDFSPQYAPKAFLIPMPLDRAQIMVSRPWYAPAMVYQFAEELRTGQLRTTAQAYTALLKAMLPPGMSDPPAYKAGEAPLFWFVNPLAGASLGASSSPSPPALSPSDGARVPAGRVSGTAAGGSALPWVVAAGLFVAGAPIAIPVAIVWLAGKK